MQAWATRRDPSLSEARSHLDGSSGRERIVFQRILILDYWLLQHQRVSNMVHVPSPLFMVSGRCKPSRVERRGSKIQAASLRGPGGLGTVAESREISEVLFRRGSRERYRREGGRREEESDSAQCMEGRTG
eukprot:3936969-Rhodomonas_salina.1